MSSLIFDESTLIDGNIFKFENRLKSQMNKYIEGGAILSIYYSQDENASTVDRGLQDIDKLFGLKAPLRFNKVNNLPLYGLGQANPNNTDERQIEDITLDGECTIIPSTIVPKPNDFFIIKHLKMNALFQVTNVTYDSMKVDGFYRIKYSLYSTSEEIIDMLNSQTLKEYYTDLNAIGTNINPVIEKDDFHLKHKIERMINKMIDCYRAMYYNTRHNCFLFRNKDQVIFDMCGNEFMAKNNIINYNGCPRVISLHNKVGCPSTPMYYNNSIYSWLEMDAPSRLIQKFNYKLISSGKYPSSSFARWYDTDIFIMHPISTNDDKNNSLPFISEEQFECFLNKNCNVFGNEYDKLIHRFIHNEKLSIHDISLNLADPLLSSVDNEFLFLFTPIVIYIARKILYEYN